MLQLHPCCENVLRRDKSCIMFGKQHLDFTWFELAKGHRMESRDRMIKAVKAAFPHTLPVLTGFIFLGIAYGILMDSKGFNLFWTLLMSAAVFAGSMQYVAITILAAPFSPVYALLMTLVVNARHLFYGVSMLEKFKGTGRFKPYLIFGMCDETFSVLVSTEPPPGIDRTYFMVAVTALDRLYWITGSAIGSLIGGMVSFDTKGLDFALTALFVVIFINQWRSALSHKPALIGLFSSAICLMLFGVGGFVVPSMALIIALLTVMKNGIEGELGREAGKW